MAELVIVIWLGCGIVCALVAGSKHRSRVGWFLLGLIFGIFALCLLACLPNGPVRHA